MHTLVRRSNFWAPLLQGLSCPILGVQAMNVTSSAGDVQGAEVTSGGERLASYWRGLLDQRQASGAGLNAATVVHPHPGSLRFVIPLRFA
jgi:hypothetical protein